MAIREERHQYIVLFRGDDSDFVGNQQILLKLETELDLTGCKAHFRFLDFKQDFDEIPTDKTLELVFPKAQTAKFPLGAMDAELWLEDSTGKRRTVANRIHVVVTNSVKQAYDNDDPQAITVVITSGSAESVSWNNITGKPSTFPPSEHTHPISQVDGLQGELNQKVNKVQNATAGNLASLTSDGGIQNSGESVASLKEYTNTQVATNTANFLGTYDYATDLGFTPPATSADVDNDAIAAALPSHVVGTPTNNDYVFVVINYTATTPADEFRRFKYNATDEEWLYEYTLNSASFTSAQWAAINSGITGVVAPSSNATTGQAADAKATGDALAARPTKAQIEAGWWSEWECEPRGMVNPGSLVYELFSVVWENGKWVLYLGEDPISADPEVSDEDADRIDFTDATFSPLTTATRHRVAAPVPTKPEDIGAQPAGNYLTQHQQLTPVYSQTPTFSEWTFSGESPSSGYHWIVMWSSPYWFLWAVEDGSQPEGPPTSSMEGSDDAVSLTFEVEGGTVVATRTRTDIVGYTLGDQTTKPLQPQGDYAPAANIAKSALASDVQTSLGKADTALQTAPVTSVNSKTGAVVLNASDIGAATAAQGAKADTAVQPAALAGYATTSQLRYDIGTETVISSASSEVVEGETVTYGSATLADRTANRVAITAAIAELRITFPVAVSGKVRDFGLRVEVGTGSAALTAPALVPPAGVTLENADGDIPALADGTATAKGVTLLYFSETAPGVFLVKGEQVTEV